MNIDFALVLVLLTFISGTIWAVDALFFAKKRKKVAAEGNEKTVEPKPEPWPVEYARSFFPIFLIVLILRSFIVEPFRIPSGSMMPTLLIGDFILVNKFDYGIRLPVLNTLIIHNKIPHRGDVVVFRYPEDPSIPFIKRVIGVPGDHIKYIDKMLYINDIPMEQILLGRYDAVGSGKSMDGASLLTEDLHVLKHQILIEPDRMSPDFEVTVPDGNYFVLGDNRDNSKDSRYWGFVPDANLIGRALYIWMNLDFKNGGPDLHRIGRIL